MKHKDDETPRGLKFAARCAHHNSAIGASLTNRVFAVRLAPPPILSHTRQGARCLGALARAGVCAQRSLGRKETLHQSPLGRMNRFGDISDAFEVACGTELNRASIKPTIGNNRRRRFDRSDTCSGQLRFQKAAKG